MPRQERIGLYFIDLLRKQGLTFNPFKQNGISSSYQFYQSIPVLRDVGWYVSFLFKLFLLDSILYVPSTIFQLCRDESSWVEPVLS